MSEPGSLFVGQLRAQRERYEGEKVALRGELRRLNTELAKTEAAQRAVEDLLRIEAPADFVTAVPPTGEAIPLAEIARPSNKPFVETALEVLSEVGAPMYYRELAEKVQARGVAVPGKNPEQNLYAHLRRDKRFVLASPGTFARQPTLLDAPAQAVTAGAEKSPKAHRTKRRGRKRTTKSGAKKKV